MDVYDNPFESKLQLKKGNHYSYPFEAVIDQLQNDTTIALVESLLDETLLREVDNYHTAFFIYRPGDYLQPHVDCAIHDLKYKVATANLYFTEATLWFRNNPIQCSPGTLVCFTNDDDSVHGVRPTNQVRMLLSVGYIGPKPSSIHRSNKRARFLPWPHEEWTEQQWALAKERSE